MKFETSKVESLVNLLRKIAGTTHYGQPSPTPEMPLDIHNHRSGNWDDIWLFLGTGTGTRQPVIKVALIGLSSEERSQLDQALHDTGEYTGRSEYVPTSNQKTALFKFIHKSAETNIRSIKTSK